MDFDTNSSHNYIAQLFNSTKKHTQTTRERKSINSQMPEQKMAKITIS